MIMNSTPKKVASGGGEEEVLIRIKIIHVSNKNCYYVQKVNADMTVENESLRNGSFMKVVRNTILVIKNSGQVAMNVTVDKDNEIIANSFDKTMCAISIKSAGTITFQ